MPWFKVDDTFHSHPKVRQAGLTSMGLGVLAGSWAAQQLTNGHIPKYMLATFGAKPADAKRLVDAGLWLETPSGWDFKDWGEYQPSKDRVLADRRAAAARQTVARSPELRAAIRMRDRDKCRYCGNKVNFSDRRGALGGTYDHVIPDGPSDLENLVVCCRGCNSSKGRRTPKQAGMVLVELSPTQIRPNSDLNRVFGEDLGAS